MLLYLLFYLFGILMDIKFRDELLPYRFSLLDVNSSDLDYVYEKIEEILKEAFPSVMFDWETISIDVEELSDCLCDWNDEVPFCIDPHERDDYFVTTNYPLYEDIDFDTQESMEALIVYFFRVKLEWDEARNDII